MLHLPFTMNSLRSLIEVYGQSAAPAAKRGVRINLKEARDRLHWLQGEYRRLWWDPIINRTHFKEQPQVIKDVNEYIDQQIIEAAREVRKYEYQLEWLDGISRGTPTPAPKRGVSDEQIERARAVPIWDLAPVRRNLTKCLWHDDKHPSMHVYADHAYCFTCAKRADAIDFVMAERGCTFIEAVRELAP